ncbi:hypothetical protein [Actinotalea sp.]|uniref:hypothetical protein n=1 Tax=Actinotalea sp. TaxID=1872145 RepID=UPI002CA64150|nr:hypothetical protein [Actinotalea sp.]HQY34736.1 hypothetical protein [Actinotalea sp.]HRA50756.1 hypothetical protein [Actinotalea sp.]
MPEYLFVNGPLAGQAITSNDPHTPGDLLAVEVVDVDQHPDDVPLYDYYVETLPDPQGPGRLRLVC